MTVFYQGDAQSVLLEQYPALRPDREDDPLAGDWELLGRQKVTFSPAALDEDCLARVAAEFDGVLIDAGAAPGLAPNFAPAEDTPGGMDAVDGMNGVDALTLYWRDNICCAGWLSRTPTGHVYASASAQAGQGRRAAQTLERLVGKVSLTAAREKVQGPCTRLWTASPPGAGGPLRPGLYHGRSGPGGRALPAVPVPDLRAGMRLSAEIQRLPARLRPPDPQ